MDEVSFKEFLHDWQIEDPDFQFALRDFITKVLDDVEYDSYNRGFDDGRDEAYEEGYQDGVESTE